MIKEKKCKGTGIAKGYGCGKPTAFRVYGLGKMCCYANWLLNSENGKIKVAKLSLKVSKPKFDYKKAKENTTDWNKKLQKKINLIVRLIDYNQPCPAKGKLANQMHAGHVFSRGSNPNLRYNLHNIHRQSAQSNHFQNEDGLFRDGLTKEYGISYYEFISNLRASDKLKITTIEYINLYKIASKIALFLKKDVKEYTLLERIELRNKYNLELNIYDNIFCFFDPLYL